MYKHRGESLPAERRDCVSTPTPRVPFLGSGNQCKRLSALDILLPPPPTRFPLLPTHSVLSTPHLSVHSPHNILLLTPHSTTTFSFIHPLTPQNMSSAECRILLHTAKFHISPSVFTLGRLPAEDLSRRHTLKKHRFGVK